MDKELAVIGTIQSEIKDIASAPKMEDEAGAVRARIIMDPAYAEGLDGLEPGAALEIFTWFHKSDRSVLKVHPRGIKERPLRGVFATRSPARPNPIGLHRVTLVAIEAPLTLVVEPLEAIDGTPVIDIKPKPKGR
ncbi:tRNA (N6-threonylcarbamoyladenosine(37)-N6)-methyltransferase TrmO [Pseudodesulfovibrio thermohalotolerans]|jgi:L-fuculose-phosphate aldolase|uniref:tRNA (N6-threonylcarbamoyladenosine(37)-N6)-methyltransferase TrmO n=1 Tax=Pseudodesulfovibrio thermohalotolerans TaxID=2880651 RepID=UPI0022B9EFD8|nr:tRNA (N6-threonylcarbamoyladenosine(37)-N6)-methyltransferase TrmO [Pseudodesulfovibrio thermohalotolerans]WFS64138.1 tRNA (N6-threonylcarbamoyladenosine(37)-N6)-methyltransferase TrmO [Pseudodesulfovibrio thermohalotolerans]